MNESFLYTVRLLELQTTTSILTPDNGYDFIPLMSLQEAVKIFSTKIKINEYILNVV